MSAVNTMGTVLMQGTTSGGSTTWDKLVDIKTAAAMGGAPEQLETTTLSDWMRTYIPGIEGNDQKEYKCNYDKTKYSALKALKGQELDLSIWFGGTISGDTITATGSDGKFTFKGYVDVYVNESEVNNVREMTVVVTPSSAITFE